MNAPFFVLTSDIDWASDACIADMAETVAGYDVRPVFMATGESAVLRRLHKEGRIELGIHPNFLAGSSHGATEKAVIEHMMSLYPDATTYRTHSFVENSHITLALRARGFTYDSNLGLHLQRNLQPLRHWSGLTRFPVFWEDDVYWRHNKGVYDLDAIWDDFMSPGLKVLSVHPVNFALNIPDAEGYAAIRSRIPSLTAEDIAKLRFKGPGTRDFVLKLVERLREQKIRVHTLAELYRDWNPWTASKPAGSGGRGEKISEADYQSYRGADATQRQQQLKAIFERRDATDRYATSRDYNMRELEIQGIGQGLPQGDILDLGCGNGYTLIALSKTHPGRRMVGVDYSENLIKGAKLLAEKEGATQPIEWVCADAITYVKNLPDKSVDGVITERFLINMPDDGVQRAIIRDIHRVLRPGGRLMMCEGSMEGFRGLNDLRVAVGLDPILERSADNPAAIRFEDKEIERFVTEEAGFRLLGKFGMSLYFTISRVLNPLLVAPQQPKFDAPINDLAGFVQSKQALDPGIGSSVVWLLERV